MISTRDPTDIELRVLDILEQAEKALSANGNTQGVTCAWVARQLWPDSWTYSKQGVKGQWLPGRAGRILHRMADDRLIRRISHSRRSCTFRLGDVRRSRTC